MTAGSRTAPAGRPRRYSWQPWLVWGLAALFFLYGFFQRVTPSVMIDHLMREFSVSGALLGNLSALYFYSYAALQIPVGLMVDRWGPRRLLTLGTGLCTLGVVCFSLGESLGLVYLGRLMIGAGAGFGFVSGLTLAAVWFPPRRFGLLVGLTMSLGMAGGFLGQAPLAALVEAVGWRAALLYSALFGAALCLATALLVRDRPVGADDALAAESPRKVASLASLWRDLRIVAAAPRNWAIAMIAAAMVAPVLSFAGLWGVAWLMQVEGMSRPEAAGMASLLLVGFGVGSPLAGGLSDRLGRRKPPLVTGAALAMASLALLIYGPSLPVPARGLLFFATGACCGAMSICFAMVREANGAEVRGLAVAFLNTAVVATGALFQPLLGALLDWRWQGETIGGARLYRAEHYDTAFAPLIVFLLASMVLGFFLRDTTGSES